MTAFYNENDPYAAAWLRNLIAAGHIAPGIVDERPIQEIEAWELAGFTQCHFFAGIGVWSHALRRAGWPDDKSIWTGSCPCQPFSNAGQRKGISDDRHLWPFWFGLIEQCKPSIVLGEQVASKDGLGWLDLVSADMERTGYAIGASDLCAAGFQQAHLRQRLYFVAVAHTYSRERPRLSNAEEHQSDRQKTGRIQSHGGLTDGCGTGRLADAAPEQHHRSGRSGTSGRIEYPDGGATGGLVLTNRTGLFKGREGPTTAGHGNSSISTSSAGRLVNSDLARDHKRASGREQSLRDEYRGSGARSVLYPRKTGLLDDADWLLCRNPAGEPSWRPVEPGTFPLAHGIASRMGKLRAYGNGLDAETATAFCEVVKEIVDEIGV